MFVHKALEIVQIIHKYINVLWHTSMLVKNALDIVQTIHKYIRHL